METNKLFKEALKLSNDLGVAKKITFSLSSYDNDLIMNLNDWEFSGENLDDVLLEAVESLKDYEKELKEIA